MNVETAEGRRPTIPAKMMKLTPLPIPFSVISSPSHMSRMEPAVRVRIWVRVTGEARSNWEMTWYWEDARTARKP